MTAPRVGRPGWVGVLWSPLSWWKVTVFPLDRGVVQRELAGIVEGWDVLTLRRRRWGRRPSTGLVVLGTARGICGRDVGTTFPLFL